MVKVEVPSEEVSLKASTPVNVIRLAPVEVICASDVKTLASGSRLMDVATPAGAV